MQRRVVAALTLLLAAATLLRAQGGDTLYVATYVEVRAASERQGASLAAEYARATRAAAGSVRVEALQEIERANRFVVIEAWKDQAAFDAQQTAAPTMRFREQLKAIHRGPYDQRLHRGFAVDPMPAATGRGTLYAVTHVDVPAARRQDAEALLKPLFEASLRDAGRVRNDVYQQVDPRPNHFTLLSAWESRRAYDAYGSTPHWLKYREALGPMLGALYDERLYEPLRP